MSLDSAEKTLASCCLINLENSERRADAFVVTVVSVRITSENVHQCDAGKH
jgi:hypothetical protein